VRKVGGGFDENGSFRGRGTLTYANSVYTGECVDNEENGHGIWRYTGVEAISGPEATSYVYEGEWKNGKKNGHGTAQWSGKAVYEGEYVDDKPHGRGTRWYTNGNIYEGEWVEGKRHGHGLLTYANGTVYDGEWADDVFHGPATCRNTDGVIKGVWLHNEPFSLYNPKTGIYEKLKVTTRLMLSAHKIDPETPTATSTVYGGWSGHEVTFTYNKVKMKGKFEYAGALGHYVEELSVDAGHRLTRQGSSITLECEAAPLDDFLTTVQLTLSPPADGSCTLQDIWAMLADDAWSE